MDTSSVALDAQLRENNHGSWYLHSYSTIAIYINSTANIATTRSLIQRYFTNNTGSNYLLTVTGDEGWSTTGAGPSFYQQLDATGS